MQLWTHADKKWWTINFFIALKNNIDEITPHLNTNTHTWIIMISFFIVLKRTYARIVKIAAFLNATLQLLQNSYSGPLFNAVWKWSKKILLRIKCTRRFNFFCTLLSFFRVNCMHLLPLRMLSHSTQCVSLLWTNSIILHNITALTVRQEETTTKKKLCKTKNKIQNL